MTMSAASAVVRCAAEVLGLPISEVAVSNYAALAGDSLAAMRLVARVWSEIGIRLAPRELLEGVAWDRLTVLDEREDALGLEAIAQSNEAPISPQQKLVLFDRQLDVDSTTYHFHALVEFEQPPPVQLLQARLDMLVEAYPILLADFQCDAGEWVQHLGRMDRPLVETSVTTKAIGSPLIAVDGPANRPFRIGSEAPIRWTLATRSDGSAALIHTEHHLVHDGVSFNLLVHALEHGAAKRDSGYGRYASWQAGELRRAARLAHSVQAAESLPIDLQILQPLGGPIDAGAQFGHLRIPVPAPVWEAIERRAATANTTPFVAALGAFADAVRSLWRPSHPFTLGVAVANRPTEFGDSVGMFVSTVPIVVSSSENGPSLAGLSDSVRYASELADLDISELARKARLIGITPDAWMPSVAFSMHQQERSRINMCGHLGRIVPGVWNGSAKFPLNVILVESRDLGTRELVFEFRRSFVDYAHIWLLWTRFVSATRGEQELPAPAPSSPVCPPRAAARTVAVLDDDESFTYAELDRLARQVRGKLATEESQVIGILGPPSARLVACQYAVHRAGHTFLPMSLLSQTGGLREMAEITACRTVIATETGERVSELPEHVGVISWETLHSSSDSSPLPGAVADCAYILFTSGTTGAQKGVRVRTRSLASLATWGASILRLSNGSIVSQVADPGFDASIWEVWPALAAGATVRVVPEASRRDPFALVEALVGAGVEVAFAPTPIAELLMAAEWPSESIRILGAGGDRLHAFPRRQPFVALNLYGPTEATSVSTFAFVESSTQTQPSIGTPVPYGFVRIVDEHGSEAPVGGEGELWVGGHGVAAGYVDLPDEQDSRFVPDPFSVSGSTVYRTGDIARWNADGSIEFLGRRDRQVKIAGVRVELGSVEATVLHVDGVASVAVDVLTRGSSTVLQIYVASASLAAEIEVSVRRALPRYLQSSAISVVPRLPLDKNGKVDFAALRELNPPTGTAVRGALSDRSGHADLVANRLGDFLLSPTASGSWFDLGGTSLGAAQFASWATEHLKVQVRLSDLLNAADVIDFLRGVTGRTSLKMSGLDSVQAIASLARDLSEHDRAELLAILSRDD